MRKTILIVLLVAAVSLFLAGVVHKSEPWSTYLSGPGRYSVEAPEGVQEASESMPSSFGEMVLHHAVSTHEDVAYHVSYTDLPQEFFDRFLEEDIVRMIALLHGTDGHILGIHHSEPWNGHPSFYGEFDTDDGAFRILSRSMLVGKRLYRLSVAVPTPSLASHWTDYESFVESFQIRG